MIYDILNYDKYQKRIQNILKNNSTNMNFLVKQPPIAMTRFGYPVEHYTLGDGPNHFIIVGGTHGNELISVDFVTQLMQEIATGQEEFSDFSIHDYTIHFIPLQNPEGFIINTSIIGSYLNIQKPFKLDEDTINSPEVHSIEQLCYEYYLAYRADDALSKLTHGFATKYHHSLFQNITPEVIPDDSLKASVAEIYYQVKFPAGSLIDWRSNGSGIDLNANTPYHYQGLQAQKNNDIVYGTRRVNNVRNYVKGPLGAICDDPQNFTYEPENIGLIDLLIDLYQKEQYCGMLTFHGTAGWIYYEPYTEHLAIKNFTPLLNFSALKKLNRDFSDIYSIYSDYQPVLSNSNTGVGDLLRSNFPAVLLIELSKMGGNPLGPYGDVKNNYIPLLKSNFAAVKAILTIALILKSHMYPNDPLLSLQYPK